MWCVANGCSPGRTPARQISRLRSQSATVTSVRGRLQDNLGDVHIYRSIQDARHDYGEALR